MTKQRYHYQINIRERKDAWFFVRLSIMAQNPHGYDEPVYIHEWVEYDMKECYRLAKLNFDLWRKNNV